MRLRRSIFRGTGPHILPGWSAYVPRCATLEVVVPLRIFFDSATGISLGVAVSCVRHRHLLSQGRIDLPDTGPRWRHVTSPVSPHGERVSATFFDFLSVGVPLCTGVETRSASLLLLATVDDVPVFKEPHAWTSQQTAATFPPTQYPPHTQTHILCQWQCHAHHYLRKKNSEAPKYRSHVKEETKDAVCFCFRGCSEIPNISR